MKWWLLMVGAMAVVVLLALPPPSAAAEDLSAQALEKSVESLLIPLVGDVTMALQGFINIGKIGLGVARFIELISSQIFNLSAEDMNFGSYVPQADRKLLAMFEMLSRRLDQMEHGIHGIASSMRTLADNMQNMVRWEIALNTMEEYSRPINTLYKRFLLYQKMKDRIEDHTLMDFANSVVSHQTQSVMSLMANLHSMAAPTAALHANSFLHIHSQPVAETNDPRNVYMVSEKVTQKMAVEEKLLYEDRGLPGVPEKLLIRPSLFQMLKEAIESSDHCQLHQSPQQLIEDLYLMLALTQARGFAMLEFSWMLLKIYNEGNFTVEQQMSESLYMQYSEDTMKEAHNALVGASNSFYKCDPRQHRDGETYLQLTELLQGYVENEVDMNSDGSCSQNCRYYQHAKSEGCFMPSSQYCGKHRRCRGTVHDCRFYDADAWLCLSRNPYRRYESIEYENGMRLGANVCNGYEMKVDSWWRFMYHCSYCLCVCDDPHSPSTDRFISLMPAVSDTKNNMVVTGVKFTKQRRVLHLQVQQGQALPQGQVNSSTLHWVDVEPINIISTAYQEGTHYKRLSYEDRSLDLDLLQALEDHVVTGLKFRMLGSHINFEIQITPVNYTSGKLHHEKSYWISNDNTPAMAKNPRRELKLDSPDDPAKFPGHSRIDSEPDTFIRFGPTDRYKDVAQLTVPFFDAQTVAPTPSSWFSGVELFHKGQPGSGGFLGLKVITYNMTPYMELSETESNLVDLYPVATVPSE